jgi:anti-sigma regulatory factor (Ser/Thr protein kinase)
MSKAAPTLAQVRTFDGKPEQIQHVRAFVAELIAGCPVVDDVVLLTSELATNAIRHTASGVGGSFSIVVRVESKSVKIEVHDLGAMTEPVFTGPDPLPESGVGLGLVEGLASYWGFYGDVEGRVVWFEMDWQ